MPADPDKTVTVTMGSDGQIKVEVTHTDQYKTPPSITITKRDDAAKKDEAKDLSLFKNFVDAKLTKRKRKIVGKVTKIEKTVQVTTADLRLSDQPKPVTAPGTYDVTVVCSGGTFTDTITVGNNGEVTNELKLKPPA